MITLLHRDYPNLRDAPAFRLHSAALDDQAAAEELARRHGELVTDWTTSARRRSKIEAHFLKGLLGQPDVFAFGRGGNFARGLSRAHNAGALLRMQIQGDGLHRYLLDKARAPS